MLLFQKHVSTNAISQAIKQYAQHEVPHRLCSGTLDPSAIRIVRPQIEKKRSARKVLLADQKKVVLRPFTGRGARKEACAYKRLIELLQDNGVPVPRVLFVDASGETHLKYGFCIVCEEIFIVAIMVLCTDLTVRPARLEVGLRESSNSVLVAMT